MNIIKEVKKLKNSEVKQIVNGRLKEFKKLNKEGNKEWFSELCFCILTANSKAETALKIQTELKDCFGNASPKKVKQCIINNKHRFHNNKTKYIIEARNFLNIKDIILKEKEPREWLVKNIKGLGYKESSHFLRNVGYDTYAILDRHILVLLGREKTINPKLYKEVEKEFIELTNKLKMNAAELDLYMWYLKTGKVLK